MRDMKKAKMVKTHRAAVMCKEGVYIICERTRLELALKICHMWMKYDVISITALN